MEDVPDQYEKIANDMGIALYQRFTRLEASLFLRCPEKEIERLVSKYELNYIRIGKTEVQFFGYQLIEYLLNNVTNKASSTIPEVDTKPEDNFPERILRTKEITEITGLSRSTIWRMEKAGKFPKRVRISETGVGWRWSEVSNWMKHTEKK